MSRFRLCGAGLLCFVAGLGAQTVSTVTTVSTSPAGASFYVDGSAYASTTTATWQAYSKHILSVSPVPQNLRQSGVRLEFQQWTWAGGSSPSNELVITADPAIRDYIGVFAVSYAVTVDCIAGSGNLYINGTLAPCAQATYFAAGSVLQFTASPGPGYVFTGFSFNPNRFTQGTTNVTLTAPLIVTPLFQPAHEVDIHTVPDGLRMLVDGANVGTPYSAEWLPGSVHNISPVSPQQDLSGNTWVAAPASSAGVYYTVPASPTATTLTSTFVPGVPARFSTSPFGLSLTIDGRSNWTSYSFFWASGETHTVSASQQQTDSQGRLWVFSSWSNGGSSTQSIVVPENASTGGVNLVATYKPAAQISLASVPSGIVAQVDGAPCTTPCLIQRQVGTAVQVSVPATQYLGESSRLLFQGWNGSTDPSWTITAPETPVTYTASYRTQFRLSLAASPAGAASFSATPSRPDWFYDAGTPVTIVTAPALGYRIGAWSGDILSNSASATLVVDAPKAAVLQLQAVPAIAPLGVQNAAGTGSAAGLAAGSIISIFGENLASGTIVGSSNPLAQTLGDATVQVDNAMLPLMFISSTQINAQLASSLSPGPHTLTVQRRGMPDATTTITLVRNAPGLFYSGTSDTPIGLFEAADGATPITRDNPAHPGAIVTLLGTGLGPYTQVAPDGFILDEKSGYTLVDPVAVIALDGSELRVLYAGRSSAGVGVDAIRFQLPSSQPSGSLMPITIRVGGQSSNTVFLPVAQ